MKKLLITTDTFLPRWDGIARFLSEMIPGLRDAFQITIVCPAFPGVAPQIPGVKLVRFPLVNIRFGDIFFSSFNRKRVKALVREHDLVFNNSLGPIGMSAILAAKKLKRPVVSYVHNIEWDLVSKSVKRFKRLAWFSMKLVARWFYNRCTLLLVPSKELEELLTIEGVRTKKFVVQLGVDTVKFVPPVTRTDAKKNVGINPALTVIGYVGRLAREKNLGTLYSAFQKIKREFKDAILLIVGAGIDEMTRPDPRVIFVGNQDVVAPYYQAMDVYVLPSLTETTSLSTLEAMASGCAVLSTPVGSIREYIDDGKNGLIFPRRDVNTLAELLRFMLTHEKTRQALGSAARKTVEETRSSKNVVIQIRNALLSV
ncbi:glycosyltransferase family 4 protein [Candidatus Woesearchaeota archaeon]|nr:glycosyltransferase family 4 protein [Candidatus Woesearchaeota archaeon]